MKYCNLVNSIDFIYDNTLVNKVIDDYRGDSCTEFLENSFIDLSVESNRSRIITDRYKSANPKFTLLKIFKPTGVKRLVFRDSDNKEIYWITTSNMKNSACIIRMIDTELNNFNPENYIHKMNRFAHLNESKDLLFNTQYASRKLINELYKKNKSEISNNNIITKEYQIFNFGNLIQSDEELK